MARLCFKTNNLKHMFYSLQSTLSHGSSQFGAACQQCRAISRESIPSKTVPTRSIRGMRDIIPPVSSRLQLIKATFETTAAAFGFEEWQTPVVESSSVFSRTLGDTSDVVQKEMYSFKSRRGAVLCLRPEGTAGIVRASIQSGMAQYLASARGAWQARASYFGPMFRYERPQQGRYRQFLQCGVEILGDPSPEADAEIILAGWTFLQRLPLHGAGFEVRLNSLGSSESRKKYEAALAQFLETRSSDLSHTSRERLARGAPLRVLDSKSPQDQDALEGAPDPRELLLGEDRRRHEEILEHLRAEGVPVVEDPRLVRGLDYYRHTAFEVVAGQRGMKGEPIGARLGTVLAGGRYDGLSEAMGGPAIPGAGWAAGVDRLLELEEMLGNSGNGNDKDKLAPPLVVVVPFGYGVSHGGASGPRGLAFRTASMLSRAAAHGRAPASRKFGDGEAAGSEDKANVLSESLLGPAGEPVAVRRVAAVSRASKAVKVASRAGARVAVLVGEEEAYSGGVTIKCLGTGRQEQASLPGDILARVQQMMLRSGAERE